MGGAVSSDPDSQTYFRRDQRDGISPPDPSKECTFAEHIVHARGKRTQYTSVSLDLSKINIFGEIDYVLKRDVLLSDEHELVDHDRLIKSLKHDVEHGEREVRLRAIQARRYATLRKEGLVNWRFATTSVERKDLISWAGRQVQKYFRRHI